MPTSLAHRVREKAELATAQFDDRVPGRLDHSVRSLAAVDELLAEAADFRDVLEPAQIDALVEIIGSYVLDVAHRTHGGDFSWFEARRSQCLSSASLFSTSP